MPKDYATPQMRGSARLASTTAHPKADALIFPHQIVGFSWMANVYGVQMDTSYGTTCVTPLGSAPNSVTSSDVTSAYPGTT